jgi:hypothetical protein
MRNIMKKYRFWKLLKIVAVVILAATVFGEVVMHLWNWLMPALFGLKTLTFVQALGMLLLSKILFGGFHRHAGGRGGRGWGRHMEERFAKMSPEERERFRSGMRGRWGCGFRPSPETQSEPTTV